MPCDCGYMEATWAEREISRVACLIDELNGKKKIDRSHWDGYHPRVYGQTGSKDAENIKKELFNMLIKRKKPITEYSLEMQIFYRNYIEENKKKEAKIRKKEKEIDEKKVALAKLTPREKDLLGV